AANEILQDGKLAKKGSGQGMPAAIPPGMRAVTIKTAKISGVVGGLLSPSDRVDVLLTVTTADKELGAFTATLLNYIEVLAVGQATEAASDKKAASDVHSVSLLVTPSQDAKLRLAESKGTLHLSLRNPNDKQPAAEGKTTLEELGLMVGKLVPKQ